MSSVRVQKYFQAMPEQVRRLLGLNETGVQATQNPFGIFIVWQGRIDNPGDPSDGKDAAVLDFDSPTWAAGHRRAVIVATPASDLNNTTAMKTQSHAAGYFLDGSVRWDMYVEAPSLFTDAQAYFDRAMEHHLRGQLGAPTTLWYCAHGTEPTVKGANGAGSTASFTSAGTDLPALWPAPGGV